MMLKASLTKKSNFLEDTDYEYQVTVGGVAVIWWMVKVDANGEASVVKGHNLTGIASDALLSEFKKASRTDGIMSLLNAEVA